MKSFRALLCAYLVFASILAMGQAPKQKSAVDFVKDVATLLATHFPTKEAVQEKADEIARTYRDTLKTISKQVNKVSTEASNRLADMDFKAKLGLAMELWRIRSSIDLLSLASPDTFHALTGLNLPDLKDLSKKLSKAESDLEAMLPWKL